MGARGINLFIILLSHLGILALLSGCAKTFETSAVETTFGIQSENQPAPEPIPEPMPFPTPSPNSSQTSTSTLKLLNLPSNPTSATSASIGFEIQNGTGNETVYCRMDSYTPIVCPNPFRLGMTNPLIGSHRVDYYIDRGSGYDVANPHQSYSWVVSANPPVTQPPSPPTPMPTPLPTPAPSPSPATNALQAAPIPVATAISGYSGLWDGTATINGADGQVRLSPVLDPKGSGRKVNFHRMVQGDPLIYGGQRSELLWIDKENMKLYPGRDYWMAFAVMRKGDEAQYSSTPFGTTNYNDTYDELLVMQTHTPQSGDTQPDIGLFFNSQGNYAGWRVAYNSSGNIDSNGWIHTEGNPWVSKEAMPAPDTWTRYVVHYRPGYNTSHQPKFEVWRARPGANFEQIANYTGFNTYNTSKGVNSPSYPRIGLYGGGNWSSYIRPSYGFYMTTLYFGEGANLLELSKAALIGF